MKDFCGCIENRVVYPVLIKNNKNSYLTLYYYTERSDSILHNDEKISYILGQKRKWSASAKSTN